ncbi:unnamed protein product [Phytophthora fragariaefolia]|uniref:Unnamed protein product n=1 Tax=Phytophthora fragariaefolia TaxID=1490495 RepID=A0A9W6WXF6_9STRA|nr:unnamed protein product [Phytophthora fragariaefolia]
MDGVRKVVDSGRTIVCTIHQPSSDVFFLFDHLIHLWANAARSWSTRCHDAVTRVARGDVHEEARVQGLDADVLPHEALLRDVLAHAGVQPHALRYRVGHGSHLRAVVPERRLHDVQRSGGRRGAGVHVDAVHGHGWLHGHAARVLDRPRGVLPRARGADVQLALVLCGHDGGGDPVRVRAVGAVHRDLLPDGGFPGLRDGGAVLGACVLVRAGPDVLRSTADPRVPEHRGGGRDGSADQLDLFAVRGLQPAGVVDPRGLQVAVHDHAAAVFDLDPVGVGVLRLRRGADVERDVERVRERGYAAGLSAGDGPAGDDVAHDGEGVYRVDV